MQENLKVGNYPNLPEQESWINLMFTHDIHIVGLTLDVCEIDLWWLLTYRAQLFHSDPSIRKHLKNEITLYSNEKPESDAFATQKALFERLHVNVISVPPKPKSSGEMDYIPAYEEICDLIHASLVARQSL